jgi:hypothetical protein
LTSATATTETLYDLAVRLLAAGISVLPIRRHAKKAPALPAGDPVLLGEQKADVTQLRDWFRHHNYGIAAKCGGISGGLECLDFDEVGLFDEWFTDVRAIAPELLARLVIVTTPSGGQHVWLRSDQCGRNQVLAKRPATEDELAEKPDAPSKVRIETRGAGGYALLPGCPPECHPDNKPYAYHPLSAGDMTVVPTLTGDERQILLNCCRAFNTFAEEPRGQPAPPTQRANGAKLPGTDYEERGSWQDLLEPLGWRLDSGDWNCGRLTRPGKDRGCSATLGVCRGKRGEPLLNIFSTSVGVELGCYGLFRALVFLQHKGDYSAAARTLGQRGFGEQRQYGRGHAIPQPTLAEGEVPNEPAATAWPEIIPFDDLAPPPAFPLDVYTPTVRAIIDTITRDTRAPMDYAACTVLSTTAAAIGATCVAVGKGDWVEQPALWIGLIGAPSMKKTPSMKLVQRPLKRINAKRIERAKMRDAERGAFGTGEDNVKEPRLFDNDEGLILLNECTAEGIMRLYARQRRGLIYTRSEISAWMGGFDQYKSSGNDRQLWIELYDGGDYHKVNVGSEIHCGSICQNICGGIQPAVIEGFLNTADGLDARFLWCYPQPNRATQEDGYVADKALLDKWNAIVERLFSFSLQIETDLYTREERLVPNHYRMTPEAWQRWVAYTRWQADILNDEATAPKVRDWIGKAEGFGLRLAITLRLLAEATDEVRAPHAIEAADIDRAAKLVAYFYGMALRVYGVAQQNVDADRLQRLVAWGSRWTKKRQAEGEGTVFTDRDCFVLNHRRYPGLQELRIDLWKLRDHGYIREVPKEKSRADAATAWELNPSTVSTVAETP